VLKTKLRSRSVRNRAVERPTMIPIPVAITTHFSQLS